MGSIEFKDGWIEAIYHEEGRVVFDPSGSPQYEGYLKGHLGNTRLVFCDADNSGTTDLFSDCVGGELIGSEVYQESHYYPFGMSMDGPWNQNVNTPENKYLDNGKELNHR